MEQEKKKSKFKKLIKSSLLVIILVALIGMILGTPNNKETTIKYRLYAYYQDDKLLNHFELYDHYYIEFNNDDSTYEIVYKKVNEDEHKSSGTFTKDDKAYYCDSIVFTIESNKIISTEVMTVRLEFKLD